MRRRHLAALWAITIGVYAAAIVGILRVLGR
jgi:hypothetical protein